jgi:hypothetical protein
MQGDRQPCCGANLHALFTSIVSNRARMEGQSRNTGGSTEYSTSLTEPPAVPGSLWSFGPSVLWSPARGFVPG